MLHAWAANIRCDRYCSNFLDIEGELNKGLTWDRAMPTRTLDYYVTIRHGRLIITLLS